MKLIGGWRVRGGAVCAALTLAVAGCGGSSGGPPVGPTPPGPSLSCPANIQTPAVEGQPTPVNYDTPVAQNGQAPVTTTCAPLSGSAFPLGDSTVTCTATDALARSTTCSFTVAVTKVPQLGVTRILAFGDSLTAGTTSPDPMTLALVKPDSYPYQLNDLLTARYTDQTIEVINEGCGGEFVAMENSNCAGGVQRLPVVLNQHKPQVVLIMHGANDLRRSSREVSGIVGAIEQMVGDAQRRGVKVMVASLPPQNPEGRRGDAAPRLPEFTRKLQEMADDEGAEFVDLYGIMGTWQGYIGADGLHPTVTGYGKIAEIFRDRIQERFEKVDEPAPSIKFTRR